MIPVDAVVILDLNRQDMSSLQDAWGSLLEKKSQVSSWFHLCECSDNYWLLCMRSTKIIGLSQNKKSGYLECYVKKIYIIFGGIFIRLWLYWQSSFFEHSNTETVSKIWCKYVWYREAPFIIGADALWRLHCADHAVLIFCQF